MYGWIDGKMDGWVSGWVIFIVVFFVVFYLVFMHRTFHNNAKIAHDKVADIRKKHSLFENYGGSGNSVEDSWRPA